MAEWSHPPPISARDEDGAALAGSLDTRGIRMVFSAEVRLKDLVG
jgi:hypothetical protein